MPQLFATTCGWCHSEGGRAAGKGPQLMDSKRDDDFITVVIPEFVPAKWWQHLLHNQSSLLLKGALLFKKGVVVVNVPYRREEAGLEPVGA